MHLRQMFLVLAIGWLICGETPAAADDTSRPVRTLWKLVVEGPDANQGGATIAETDALAAELDRRATRNGEHAELEHGGISATVEKGLHRLKFLPRTVVIEERTHGSNDVRITVQRGDAADHELRLRLLRLPRFDTAEIAQVVQYRGKVDLPGGFGESAYEFETLAIPGQIVEERYRQIFVNTADIDPLRIKMGGRYLLLRTHVVNKRVYYQQFPYEGAIKTLIDGAPPPPSIFSRTAEDEAKEVAQCRYYFEFIGSEDPLVACVAALTATGGGDKTLLQAGPKLPLENLRSLLRSPRWGFGIRSRFAILVASHHDPKDEALILELLDQSIDDAGPANGSHRIAFAYALIAGDRVFDELDVRMKGASSAKSRAWRQMINMLTRTLRQSPGVVSRERILQHLRSQLQSDALLQTTIQELNAWKDWDSLDEVAAKFPTVKESWVRSDVVTFLLDCIDDQPSGVAIGEAPHQIKAKELLARIRLQDAKFVEFQEKLRTFSPKRPTD